VRHFEFGVNPDTIPIERLVERLRRFTGREAVHVDPTAMGVRSPIIIVKRDPCARGAGALGFTSIRHARGQTAARERAVCAAVGLDPVKVCCWNAFPYHIGRRDPTATEWEEGRQTLRKFLALFPDDVVVIGSGVEARMQLQRAGRRDVVKIPHTGPKGCLGAAQQPGGYERCEHQIEDGFRTAMRQARMIPLETAAA
jgi:hypothetical protein